MTLRIVARKDDAPFLMLLENMRDILVEGWHKVDAYTPGSPPDFEEFVSSVADYKKNQFLPALRRLVETGLLLIKHDMRTPPFGPDSFGPNWFEAATSLLVEVFETAHRLGCLKIINAWKLGQQDSSEEELSNKFPALESVISVRALAIYAFKRGRYEFLPTLLKRFVHSVSDPDGVIQPFCFWPVWMPLTMPRGRDAYCWENRVRDYWRDYFGNRESFLEFACQLEFVLELNSFIGVGYGGKKMEIEKWLKEFKPGVSFAYQSHIVLHDLVQVIPLAEMLYDALVRGPEDALVYCLTVEKTLINILLKEEARDGRLLLLGRYIQYVQKAQSDYYLANRRFPPHINWGAKLEPLVKAATKQVP
jgi:hypothetical protein